MREIFYFKSRFLKWKSHLLPTKHHYHCSTFFKEPKFTCDKIGRRRVGSTKDDAGPLDILLWKIGLDFCKSLFLFTKFVNKLFELGKNLEDNLQRLKAKVKTDHCTACTAVYWQATLLRENNREIVKTLSEI